MSISPPLDFPEIDCLIDDIQLPPKNRISTSLENIRSSLPPKRPHRHSCQISSFESTRRKSTSSNRRSSVSSRRHSSRRHRTSSSASQRKWISEQQKAKEKKRKRTMYIVVGTFLFILLSCVLVVIVTLTHQSEIGKRNSTLVYYTFAPPSEVIVKSTMSTVAGEEHLEYVVVRKENEELMNSLSEDSTNHDSLHDSNVSVPISSK